MEISPESGARRGEVRRSAAEERRATPPRWRMRGGSRRRVDRSTARVWRWEEALRHIASPPPPTEFSGRPFGFELVCPLFLSLLSLSII